MILKTMVTECDFSGKTFDEPVEGGHCFARGATGRVCWVMSICDEFAQENGWEYNTLEEIEAWANEEGYLDY